MRSLEVHLGERSYPIHIGDGLLRDAGRLMSQVLPQAETAIVTHESLRALYGSALAQSLSASGFNPHWIEVTEGERTKSLEWASFLYDRLVALKMDRFSPVVAFGGGVVGDLAGFVAASYLRGVPLVQIPTTLLAQVDSSVGGKTGVNHPGGKNLIGAFHQPKSVLIDTLTLPTLPARELKAGLAEVVKYGIIWDEDLFRQLEEHYDKILCLDPSVLEQIIYRSCAIKAAVVEKDEREEDLRSILNFGHTLGHAIEASSEYAGTLHGEAVAIGMVAACRLSLERGFCSAETLERVRSLLAKIGLPTEPPPSLRRQDIVRAIELDKKTKDGTVKFVAIERIGRTRFVRLRPEEVLEAMEKKERAES